jgi:hypothetical protein
MDRSSADLHHLTCSEHDSPRCRSAVRAGRVRPMILLWALGIPVPILLVIFLIRGCA